MARSLESLAGKVEVVFVFGSVAKGTETSQSDVDVMVIGDVTFGQVVNSLYDAQTTLAREINPKVMARAEWQAKQRDGSVFVQDLMSNPKIFIVGTEDDL